MRPIDADALRMTCRLISLNPNDARVLQYAIQTMIDSAPTIDAETVRHGHWIEDDDGDGRHCSICGEDYCYLISNCELYNYCPHCGAKMDGITEDNDETN